MEVLKKIALNGSKINGVPVASSEKQLIKITGTLTSPLQLREGTKEPYHYAFVKLKGQTIDLPVIFKIKDQKVANCEKCLKPVELRKRPSQPGKQIVEGVCQNCFIVIKWEESSNKPIKLTLEKSDQVELTGYYSTSEKSVRKYFTAISWSLIEKTQGLRSYQLLNHKRIRKKCFGCCGNFAYPPSHDLISHEQKKEND